MSEPRPHHYTFVHRMLPSLLENQKAEIRDIFEGEQGQVFLRDMWIRCGEMLGDPQLILPAEGISLDLSPQENETLAVTIHFPTAQEITEGHLAVVLFYINDQPRYFVLEKSVNFVDQDDQDYSIIGEWNQGQHLNYGEGSTDPATFLQKVLDIAKG